MASSCQKNANSEATVSAVNPNCVTNPTSCNSAAYNQNGYTQYNNGYGATGGYGGNGCSSCGGNYGYNQPFNYYNNNAYLCNCSYGSVPTYNGTNGLGCVQTSGMNFGAFGYAYLSWGGSQWSNLPQNQFNYGQSSQCYNGAVQSCTVGSNPQSCPGGMVCRPNSSGSTIGLCVTSYR